MIIIILLIIIIIVIVTVIIVVYNNNDNNDNPRAGGQQSGARHADRSQDLTNSQYNIIRPVRQLRVWVSKGLTQADS